MAWISREEPHPTNPRRAIIATKWIYTPDNEHFATGWVTKATSEEVIDEWRFGAEAVSYTGKTNLGYFKFAIHAKEKIDAYWDEMGSRALMLGKAIEEWT